MAIRIEEGVRVKMETLMRMQSAYDIARALLRRASASAHTNPSLV
jgi:plasmid maintenance system antidote protein VapI